MGVEKRRGRMVMREPARVGRFGTRVIAGRVRLRVSLGFPTEKGIESDTQL